MALSPRGGGKTKILRIELREFKGGKWTGKSRWEDVEVPDDGHQYLITTSIGDPNKWHTLDDDEDTAGDPPYNEDGEPNWEGEAEWGRE